MGVGALFASAGLIASFGVLGLNSIAVARIEGADGVGLVALSAQIVLVSAFLAGVGLRTSVAYRVSAGLWSPRSAVRGAIKASVLLGLGGAALGLVAYVLLRDSALSEFTPLMAACLLGALPFTLLWWILPAIPLAREQFEQYALLTFAAPVSVLLLCPLGAVLAGRTGTVEGFAAGYLVGGVVSAAWAIRFARTPEAGVGPEHRVRDAGGFGMRAWVNDLFQFINLRPDLFIVSAYVGVAEAGVYSVTISISSLVWILSQPLASVVLPQTAGMEAAGAGAEDGLSRESQTSAVRHAVVISALATIAVVPILLLAPLVWGDGFGDIPKLGLIMLPGVALLGVARVMVAAFTGRGAANHALLVGIVSFPLALIAFLVVVPEHGATGAAVVSCATYVVASLLAAVLFFRSSGVALRAALVPRRSDVGDYAELISRGRARVLELRGR
jgi:O-antigen/teichoic acid export membrane protein